MINIATFYIVIDVRIQFLITEFKESNNDNELMDRTSKRKKNLL